MQLQRLQLKQKPLLPQQLLQLKKLQANNLSHIANGKSGGAIRRFFMF
jgi:hypothetical protein